MIDRRCLIIADDCTGGADSGARFAANGLDTALTSFTGTSFDFFAHGARDALVINTETRGAGPEKASRVIGNLLRSYPEDLFPFVYKKVDSTLRGNIGAEIDAILDATGAAGAFLAPSFPEQSRIVAGGLLLVNGQPVSATGMTSREKRTSRVEEIISEQSKNPTALIDLDTIACGRERLLEEIAALQNKGARIIIFDALLRCHLEQIADAAFALEKAPLLVGSAGLAGEVAKKIAGFHTRPGKPPSDATTFAKAVFFICGSMSSVTKAQIQAAEALENVKSFEIGLELLTCEGNKSIEAAKALAARIAGDLGGSHVILKTCPPMPELRGMSAKISEMLGLITRLVMETLPSGNGPFALVLTGGATASGVLRSLDAEGIELVNEITGGIPYGHILGGREQGLMVVTKAGGFGRRDSFLDIIDTCRRKDRS